MSASAQLKTEFQEIHDQSGNSFVSPAPSELTGCSCSSFSCCCCCCCCCCWWCCQRSFGTSAASLFLLHLVMPHVTKKLLLGRCWTIKLKQKHRRKAIFLLPNNLEQKETFKQRGKEGRFVVTASATLLISFHPLFIEEKESQIKKERVFFVCVSELSNKFGSGTGWGGVRLLAPNQQWWYAKRKLSWNICTLHTHVFARLVPIYMPSRYLLTKILRRKFTKSVLLVGQTVLPLNI